MTEVLPKNSINSSISITPCFDKRMALNVNDTKKNGRDMKHERQFHSPMPPGDHVEEGRVETGTHECPMAVVENTIRDATCSRSVSTPDNGELFRCLTNDQCSECCPDISPLHSDAVETISRSEVLPHSGETHPRGVIVSPGVTTDDEGKTKPRRSFIRPRHPLTRAQGCLGQYMSIESEFDTVKSHEFNSFTHMEDVSKSNPTSVFECLIKDTKHVQQNQQVEQQWPRPKQEKNPQCYHQQQHLRQHIHVQQHLPQQVQQEEQKQLCAEKRQRQSLTTCGTTSRSVKALIPFTVRPRLWRQKVIFLNSDSNVYLGNPKAFFDNKMRGERSSESLLLNPVTSEEHSAVLDRSIWDAPPYQWSDKNHSSSESTLGNAGKDRFMYIPHVSSHEREVQNTNTPSPPTRVEESTLFDSTKVSPEADCTEAVPHLSTRFSVADSSLDDVLCPQSMMSVYSADTTQRCEVNYTPFVNEMKRITLSHTSLNSKPTHHLSQVIDESNKNWGDTDFLPQEALAYVNEQGSLVTSDLQYPENINSSVYCSKTLTSFPSVETSNSTLPWKSCATKTVEDASKRNSLVSNDVFKMTGDTSVNSLFNRVACGTQNVCSEQQTLETYKLLNPTTYSQLTTEGTSGYFFPFQNYHVERAPSIDRRSVKDTYVQSDSFVSQSSSAETILYPQLRNEKHCHSSSSSPQEKLNRESTPEQWHSNDQVSGTIAHAHRPQMCISNVGHATPEKSIHPFTPQFTRTPKAPTANNEDGSVSISKSPNTCISSVDGQDQSNIISVSHSAHSSPGSNTNCTPSVNLSESVITYNQKEKRTIERGFDDVSPEATIDHSMVSVETHLEPNPWNRIFTNGTGEPEGSPIPFGVMSYGGSYADSKIERSSGHVDRAYSSQHTGVWLPPSASPREPDGQLLSDVPLAPQTYFQQMDKGFRIQKESYIPYVSTESCLVEESSGQEGNQRVMDASGAVESYYLNDRTMSCGAPTCFVSGCYDAFGRRCNCAPKNTSESTSLEISPYDVTLRSVDVKDSISSSTSQYSDKENLCKQLETFTWQPHSVDRYPFQLGCDRATQFSDSCFSAPPNPAVLSNLIKVPTTAECRTGAVLTNGECAVEHQVAKSALRETHSRDVHPSYVHATASSFGEQPLRNSSTLEVDIHPHVASTISSYGQQLLIPSVFPNLTEIKNLNELEPEYKRFLKNIPRKSREAFSPSDIAAFRTCHPHYSKNCFILMQNGYDIRLGEVGRAALKKEISKRLKRDSNLRERCVSVVCRLKNANVLQLLQMAEISGCLSLGLKISSMYWREYSRKQRPLSNHDYKPYTQQEDRFVVNYSLNDAPCGGFGPNKNKKSIVYPAVKPSCPGYLFDSQPTEFLGRAAIMDYETTRNHEINSFGTSGYECNNLEKHIGNPSGSASETDSYLDSCSHNSSSTNPPNLLPSTGFPLCYSNTTQNVSMEGTDALPNSHAFKDMYAFESKEDGCFHLDSLRHLRSCSPASLRSCSPASLRSHSFVSLSTLDEEASTQRTSMEGTDGNVDHKQLPGVTWVSSAQQEVEKKDMKRATSSPSQTPPAVQPTLLSSVSTVESSGDSSMMDNSKIIYSTAYYNDLLCSSPKSNLMLNGAYHFTRSPAVSPYTETSTFANTPQDFSKQQLLDDEDDNDKDITGHMKKRGRWSYDLGIQRFTMEKWQEHSSLWTQWAKENQGKTQQENATLRGGSTAFPLVHPQEQPREVIKPSDSVEYGTHDDSRFNTHLVFGSEPKVLRNSKLMCCSMAVPPVTSSSLMVAGVTHVDSVCCDAKVLEACNVHTNGAKACQQSILLRGNSDADSTPVEECIGESCETDKAICEPEIALYRKPFSLRSPRRVVNDSSCALPNDPLHNSSSDSTLNHQPACPCGHTTTCSICRINTHLGSSPLPAPTKRDYLKPPPHIFSVPVSSFDGAASALKRNEKFNYLVHNKHHVVPPSPAASILGIFISPSLVSPNELSHLG